VGKNESEKPRQDRREFAKRIQTCVHCSFHSFLTVVETTSGNDPCRVKRSLQNCNVISTNCDIGEKDDTASDVESDIVEWSEGRDSFEVRVDVG